MTPTSFAARSGRARNRTRAVLLAVASAVAVWAIATYALGIDVRSPAMGDTPPADITAAHVVIASLVASLAAWAVLAVLERSTARAHRVWGGVAVVLLLASLGAPLTGGGIAAAERAVLVLLHLAVAAVVVPGMLATARSDRTSTIVATTSMTEDATS